MISILQLPTLWGLIIISVVIALITNIAYKFMTDQKLMKEIKDKMKEHQQNMKNNKEQPEKILEANKELMELNMKYMRHSLKPMLITTLLAFSIFGWLSAHYAYSPITPGQEFTITIGLENSATGYVTLKEQGIQILSKNPAEIKDGKADFTLKGQEGEYLLTVEHEGKDYTKRLLITESQEYEKPITTITGNAVKEIKINNEISKPLNLSGWKLGWLGTYLIFSVIANLTLRKIMGLY